MSDVDEPTPAEVRAFVARVEELKGDLARFSRRFRGVTEESVRGLGFTVEESAVWLSNTTEDLNRVADKLGRIRAARDPKTCVIPWGVCPDHGATLRSSGGKTWCTVKGCGNEWGYDRMGLPCAEPAVAVVTDQEGTDMRLCAGHTTDARERLIGARIRPLSSDNGARED